MLGRRVVLHIALLWGVLLTSSFVYAAGDTVRGQDIYKACISCHGDQGQGDVTERAPRIAGQHDWYIVSQLKSFKNGTRINPKMLPFIRNLNEQDLQDLAAYIAQIK